MSNHREDAYGGSFENRMRFMMEALAAVRGAAPTGSPSGCGSACTSRTPHPGRFGTPEDVGHLAVFLASDESGFLTGTTQLLDAGAALA
ncbi:SDR family oxidoreductase [Actinophytocola glycyrrhizae]|uniref:SDR family oxidoreductase n=1 Tax=Actinophytocola glycyrrhizae TaxID=2044873 RepID=A0ABV9RUG0_9PSEU